MESTAPTQELVLKTILSAIDEMNQTLPADRQIERSPSTRLFGADGRLDSLGLVNLIVAVEQKVADEFGVGVTLADERAMSQRNSPFRSVETLADFVTMLIKEANG